MNSIISLWENFGLPTYQKLLLYFLVALELLMSCLKLWLLFRLKRLEKKLAIVIYDEKYWKSVVNFDALIEHGVINESDLKLFHFCNDVDSAFKIIKEHLEKNFLKEPSVLEPRIHINSEKNPAKSGIFNCITSWYYQDDEHV